MTRLRAPIAVLAALVVAMLLLAWFAGIERGMPWSAPQRVILDLERLQLDGARLQRVGERLEIHGASAGGVSLLMQPVEPFDAESMRYFSLRLRNVPPVYRAMVVWRRDGQLHAVPFPGMLRAQATLDLAQFEQWQGRIDAIGFAVMPTEYLAAALTLGRRFEFESGALAAPAAREALAALWTGWIAYRPWNGRSNHTAGFELSAVPAPSLQAFVFALLGIVAGALWLSGGGSLLQRHAAWLLLVALAVPAVRQSLQLLMRAESAAHASVLAAGNPAWPLAAMPALAHEAIALDHILRTRAPARVAVWGATGFHREYPAWLLREHNVASLNYPAQLSGVTEDLVLVLAGDDGWTFEDGMLSLPDIRVPARALFDGRQLRAFVVQGGGR
jgi:hypothetical protein